MPDFRQLEGLLYRRDPGAYSYDNKKNRKSLQNLDKSVSAMQDEEDMTDDEWADMIWNDDSPLDAEANRQIQDIAKNTTEIDEELAEDRKKYWMPRGYIQQRKKSKPVRYGSGGGGYSGPIGLGGGKGGSPLLQQYIQAILGRGPARWGM